MPSLPACLALFAAYLLGAVPFGLLLVRLTTGRDLREFGSGNIGATNAMRAAGKVVGVTSFVLDFAKGLAPVAAARAWLDGPAWVPVACGAAAVIGHCFPIYLRFRGGKGVATGMGALFALAPLVALLGGAVWLVTLVATRYVGLASMAMGLAFPVLGWALGGGPELIAGASLLTLLILVRHRSNMARIMAGTEPKALTRERGS